MSGNIWDKEYLSQRDIELIANELLHEYCDANGWKYQHQIYIDLQGFYEAVLYPRFEYELIMNIDLGYDEGSKVLGKVIPKERVVIIDSSLAPPNKDPRYPFTLGHEFGHGVLHKKGNRFFRCTEKKVFQAQQGDIKEIQANIFSSCLLMPGSLVGFRFQECFGTNRPVRYAGPGYYYFNIEGNDRRYYIDSYTGLCCLLATPLQRYFFNTSKQSLGLKIHKLGLVKNCTAEKFGENNNLLGNILSKAFKNM